MLELIRNLMAPKIAMRLILRGNLPIGSSRKIQDILRSHNLYGQVHLVQNSHALITMEGTRGKLESLVARLQKTPLIPGPVVLEVTWLPCRK